MAIKLQNKSGKVVEFSDQTALFMKRNGWAEPGTAFGDELEVDPDAGADAELDDVGGDDNTTDGS